MVGNSSRYILLLSLTIAIGCARYKPLPLGTGVHERGGMILQSDSIRLAARELKHPILQPVELTPGRGITPDQAGVLAVLLNPMLRAARDQRNVAAAQVFAAGILPNPQLTFSEDIANGGLDATAINAYGIGLNWDFTQLITRDAKLRSVKFQAASIELGIAWQEWQVAEAARTAVYDLIALQEQLTLAGDIDLRLGENAKLVRASVARHEKTLVDQAAADAASQDAHAALLSAGRDLRHQRLALNRAIGVDPEVQLTIDPEVKLPSRITLPDHHQLLDGLDDRRLDLVALRRGYDSQEETLRAAVLAQFPKINLGINKQRDNTDVKSIGFTADIDLPIFDHNQGDIALQTATRQQLFNEYSQRQFEARSDVIGALDDIAAIEDLLKVSEEQIPAQQRLVDTYKSSLEHGNVDVLSYYTAIGDLQQKKLNVIKLKQQLMENRIALEIAAGEFLPETGEAAEKNSCDVAYDCAHDAARSRKGNTMKPAIKWLAMVLAGGACAAGGYWYGIRHAPADQPKADAGSDADEPKPLVAVRVQPIRQGSLDATVAAYGPVQAEPSDVRVMSLPFESRIGQMRVTQGQPVAAGDLLGEISPSPDTQLQLRMAQSALAATKKDLANTQQRFNDHLATNSDLLTSQQNFEAAQLKLESLEKSGAGGAQQLKAPTAGIVAKIDVQEGQIVPAGGPLVEIAAGNRIAARLGVETGDATKLHLGDAVKLTEVRTSSAASVTGKIEIITRQIDHDTGLIDVLVALPNSSGLVLGGYVRGDFVAAREAGLIVPRDAALPDQDGYKLFTVENGQAVQHVVTLGLGNDKEVLAKADDLKSGDSVVVSGNYELADKMPVTIQKPDDSQAPSMATPATDPSPQPAEQRP